MVRSAVTSRMVVCVGAATRIFASNLNPAMAQRYYAMVLLPAARDDIHENKRLNYHLYMALRKACYKPAAFFKGIVIPLCEVRAVFCVAWRCGCVEVWRR